MNNKINKELLSKRLKNLMENNNETTYSLGEILNLSAPTISRYANGQMVPKMTTVQAIAKHFNVSSDWLAGISNSIYEEEILNDDLSVTSIPIFESIKYELPLFSNKKLGHNLTIPIEKLSKWGGVIGYEVQDDSMAPYIKKGNFVIIKLGEVSLPNNFVALHVNGKDLVIRKVIQDENSLILQPANLAYNAEAYNMKKSNIYIIGSVVYIHREENTIIEE